MKYLGGKQRLGKHIAPILKELWEINTTNQFQSYIEPFCGSLGVLKNMVDIPTEIIANDYHPDLIQMWRDLQQNRLVYPAEITEEDYLYYKNVPSPNSLKAFVGFGMSFGGKFFSGFAQKYLNHKSEDFLKEMVHSLERIRPVITNVKFTCRDYTELTPRNALIYCDPPYRFEKFPIKYRRDTKHYDEFDNDTFWNIMREWSKTNLVVISEISAPDDFIEIWRHDSYRSPSQSKKTRFKGESKAYKIEKLFVYNGTHPNYVF
jgi:DNA adenine methylase